MTLMANLENGQKALEEIRALQKSIQESTGAAKQWHEAMLTDVATVTALVSALESLIGDTGEPAMEHQTERGDGGVFAKIPDDFADGIQQARNLRELAHRIQDDEAAE